MCKVSVLEKRDLVKIVVAEGSFVITREELAKAGISETNRALSLGLGKAQPNSAADSNPAKTPPDQFDADIIRDIKLKAKRVPGDEVEVTKLLSGRKIVKVPDSTLHLHIQYQSWDLPKEYWDRQSFTEFMLRWT